VKTENIRHVSERVYLFRKFHTFLLDPMYLRYKDYLRLGTLIKYLVNKRAAPFKILPGEINCSPPNISTRDSGTLTVPVVDAFLSDPAVLEQYHLNFFRHLDQRCKYFLFPYRLVHGAQLVLSSAVRGYRLNHLTFEHAPAPQRIAHNFQKLKQKKFSSLCES